MEISTLKANESEDRTSIEKDSSLEQRLEELQKLNCQSRVR